MKASECREIFALLSQYLDEELPRDICEEIEEHISGCPPCVQFVESLKKTIELCHSCKDVAEPGPLPADVRGRLFEAYEKALLSRHD